MHKLREMLSDCLSKIRRPRIDSLLVLALCCTTLYALRLQMGVWQRVCYAVLCYLSMQRFPAVWKEIKRQFTGVFERVLLALICVYASFAITGTYYAMSEEQISLIYPDAVHAAISLIWVAPVILFAISQFTARVRNLTLTPMRTGIKMRIFMTVLLLLPCALLLIAFNPCITSYDSQYIYDAAHFLGSKPMLDGHPPFYTLLVRMCLLLCDSVTFLVALQCIFFAVIFADGICFLLEAGVPRKPVVAFYLLVLFSYSNTIQLVTFWKDIPYMTSLLWLTILLCKIVLMREKYESKAFWYIQLVAALIMVSFIRQNGIAGAAIVLALLPFVLKFRKKILISVAVTVLSIICIKGPVYSALQVAPIPGLKYYALANDILYVYYNVDEVSEETMDLVNEITSNRPEYFHYSVYYTNYNDASLHDYSPLEFCKVYINTFIDHPAVMLKAVISRNRVIMGVNKAAYEVENLVNYLDEYHDPAYAYQYPMRQANGLTHALGKLFRQLSYRPFLRVLQWRTGIYHLLIILTVLIIIVTKKKTWMRPLLPFWPIIMNVFTLFIASGWSDYRYYWPSAIIGCYLALYAVAACKMDYEPLLRTKAALRQIPSGDEAAATS